MIRDGPSPRRRAFEAAEESAATSLLPYIARAMELSGDARARWRCWVTLRVQRG